MVTEAAKSAAKIPATGGPVTPEQITMIHTLKAKVGGLTDETYRKTIAVYRQANGDRCVGADGKGTSKALSKDQASHYIGRLEDQIHKQHMRVDERVDNTADDLGAVVPPPADLDDDWRAPIDGPPVSATGKKWAPKAKPPTLRELLARHIADESNPEAEAQWLSGLFGLDSVNALDATESDTALSLLLAMAIGPDAYDEAETKARALGRCR